MFLRLLHVYTRNESFHNYQLKATDRQFGEGMLEKKFKQNSSCRLAIWWRDLGNKTEKKTKHEPLEPNSKPL